MKQKKKAPAAKEQFEAPSQILINNQRKKAVVASDARKNEDKNNSSILSRPRQSTGSNMGTFSMNGLVSPRRK